MIKMWVSFHQAPPLLFGYTTDVSRSPIIYTTRVTPPLLSLFPDFPVPHAYYRLLKVFNLISFFSDLLYFADCHVFSITTQPRRSPPKSSPFLSTAYVDSLVLIFKLPTRFSFPSYTRPAFAIRSSFLDSHPAAKVGQSSIVFSSVSVHFQFLCENLKEFFSHPI